MTKTIKTAKPVAPDFDSFAKPIVTAHKAFDKASDKLSAIVARTFQAYIDVCAKNGVGHDKPSIDAIGAAIRECETFKYHVGMGNFERTTITNYAQSAMRAYFHGVPFAPSLFTNKEMGLPWGKTSGGASDAKTSGKVQSTSRAELDKTLSKALAQARLLGLTEFAANVLDLCLESLDDFKETE
jgi:hypothetical protein